MADLDRAPDDRSGSPAPRGTKAAGKRLWRSIVDTFGLSDHELSLVHQAVRVADTCDELQAIVAAEGMVLTGGRGGTKAHPALVELRQQQILLTRLIVALRVPIGDQAEGDAKTSPVQRLQRRGARGVYGIRGGAA